MIKPKLPADSEDEDTEDGEDGDEEEEEDTKQEVTKKQPVINYQVRV